MATNAVGIIVPSRRRPCPSFGTLRGPQSGWLRLGEGTTGESSRARILANEATTRARRGRVAKDQPVAVGSARQLRSIVSDCSLQRMAQLKRVTLRARHTVSGILDGG